MATEPSLLLLDEPAAGLNIYETREMAEIVLKIREWGITVLLVEHDMSLVMDISDEIVVLNYGRKVAEGEPAQIQRRGRELLRTLSREEFLELITVAALANVMCRLGYLTETTA